MEIKKLFGMSLLVAIFTFNGAASYASENGNDGSVFLSGRIESSDKLVGCSGNCSADPGGTIGIGYDFSYMAIFGPVRMGVGIEYSRKRFNLNGNVLDVNVKAVTISPEYPFDKNSMFLMAAPVQLGIMTSGGTLIPERTGFGGSYGIDFLYQASPGLYLSIGASSIMVSTSNQADFFSDTVDIGFRWYL